MVDTSSFDIVSKVDMQEVDNAVNQAKKEIAQGEIVVLLITGSGLKDIKSAAKGLGLEG